MSNSITSLDTVPFVTPAPRRMKGGAKYDAARTTEDNRRHWQNADGNSANAANSPDVRRVLRNRARDEDANNSYINGLTSDRAHETIATGPRLKLTLPDEYGDPEVAVHPTEPDADRRIERAFAAWAKSINLLDKLLVMDMSETREGEVFVLKFINPKLPASAPQLDIRLYEADQIDTPDLKYDDASAVSGIVFDRWGNPTEYHVLRQHPGDLPSWRSSSQEYDRIPARQMVHLFEPRRAGQARGIPAFTSSLPPSAIMRRWTLAGLLTAEAQSRINAVIEQENAIGGPGNDGYDDDENADPAGEQIRFAGTHMLTLSAGQKAKTLPASAPAANYKEVKAEVLTEVGRPINAPGNVSRGTSADMNYSSGRLDRGQWQLAITVRRPRLYESKLLDSLFTEWLRLARFIPGYLPENLPPEELWDHEWAWDGFDSIDPVKDAKAGTERLTNRTSNRKIECDIRGYDWRDVQDQQLLEEAREARRRAELGLPPAPVQSPAKPQPAPVAPDGAEEVDDA